MKYFPQGPVVSVQRHGDTIVAIFENGFEAELHMPAISEVAVQVLPGKPPNLLFHKERAWVLSLPMNSAPVDQVLAHVRPLPGFEEAALADALRRTEPARIPILRRAPLVNAHLDPVDNSSASQTLLYQDIDIGFRLASTGEHIPWGITMDAALAHFRGQPGGYKESEVQIGPVQLGALRLKQVAGSSGIYRSDIPAGSWHARIVLLKNGWKQNERLLLAYFRKMLGEPQQVECWANRGETVTTWERGKISLNVKYREATLQQPEEGYCDLVIYNRRDYPEYLTDDYCSSVKPAQVNAKLFSVAKIELSGWYALSRYIRATPPGLLELFSDSGNFLVWIDKDHTNVGFADRSFAKIYPRAVIARLLLQNQIPERGGLRHSLLWVARVGHERELDSTDSCRCAGKADFGALEAIFPEIAELTGLPAQKLDDFDER